MAKRKKYPKLPNGYGQIRYLGKNRRNPFGVYPPATEVDDIGRPKTPAAICYVKDWLTGFAVLTSYRAGTYTPGDERTLNFCNDTDDLNTLAQKLLSDYNQSQNIVPIEEIPTFKEVFERYYEKKFKRQYGHREKKSAMEQSMCAAFKNCHSLHDRKFQSLTLNDLQTVIDNCPLKHASIELIVTLFHQLYDYALPNDLCERNYADYLKIEKVDDDVHGEAFTESELEKLWNDKDHPATEMILIMCYSGFRFSAYKMLDINLKEKYFQGGIKTTAGKNRVVPIHSSIYGLVKRRLRRDGSLMSISPYKFRTAMYERLNALEIKKHTPHDCRHTFSALCEKYGVNENDRKRMLGHSFSDITNRVYGHRELEDLRKEIEKIQLPINLL